MKESLRHEIQATQAGISQEQRQRDLKEQSRANISEIKTWEDRNFEKKQQKMKNRTDELIEQYRQD